jgi:hypothetical protein
VQPLPRTLERAEELREAKREPGLRIAGRRRKPRLDEHFGLAIRASASSAP